MIGTKKPPLFRLEFDAKKMRKLMHREPASTVRRTLRPAKTAANCNRCANNVFHLCKLTGNWKTPLRVSNYWTCDAFAESAG